MKHRPSYKNIFISFKMKSDQNISLPTRLAVYNVRGLGQPKLNLVEVMSYVQRKVTISLYVPNHSSGRNATKITCYPPKNAIPKRNTGNENWKHNYLDAQMQISVSNDSIPGTKYHTYVPAKGHLHFPRLKWLSLSL